MRRKLVIVLWALASVLGSLWGARLAFFPSVMIATQPATPDGAAPEIVRATYEPIFFAVLFVLLLLYMLLGLALYAHHYVVFGLIAGIHIFLSLLSVASVGTPLLPSSLLLLFAALLTIGLREDHTSTAHSIP